MTLDEIKKTIRSIPDYPKPGIIFRDIMTLLQNGPAFHAMINHMVHRHSAADVDKVVGIEARGFILGAAIAHQLGVGFVPVRKKGKLPWKTESAEYELEYGTDEVEIHIDAIDKGEKVLLVDDLIATGGTALAAIELIERLGGSVTECSFIVDLPEIGGSKKLEEAGYAWHALVDFEGH